MKRYATISNFRIVFEVLLITVLLLLAFSKELPSQAATVSAPDEPTAFYWYQCNAPNHVAVFTNRVHVYCSSTTPISGAPTLSGIYWFAVPTSPDSASASRFMSLLQTAMITGKPIWVEVNPSDTSGSSFGCGASNCRNIVGMEMR